MLALVMNLARRMLQANPQREKKALESEAIVLIDEVDLHLHPKWQQRVLIDLMAIFPNTQFIVTTHSPQVLTTIKPEHIILLEHEKDVIAEQVTSSYGKIRSRLNELSIDDPDLITADMEIKKISVVEARKKIKS
jgi:predicted ATP-binding protein involved in virulence